jgi:ankyrin repeat protein
MSINSRKRDPKDQSRLDLRRTQIVKLLIDAGASIDADDGNGCTALQAAVERNHDEIALMLIAKGTKLDTARSNRFCVSCSSGQSPLHYATRSKVVTEAMLSKGANVNVTDDQGKTPLHWAVMQQNVETVQLLVNAGANANAVDSTMKKPIDYCMLFGESYGMPFGQSYDDIDREKAKTISAILNAPR